MWHLGVQHDFNNCEYWLLDEDMSMCEMLNGICELAVTSFVMMNIEEDIVVWKITLEYELK